MSKSCFCEYWRKDWDKVKPCFNDGWILDWTRVLFWALMKLSIGRAIVFCIERRSSIGRNKYRAVDWYIFVWIIVEILIFLSLVLCPNVASKGCWQNIFKAVVSYRLFEIFQSWVSQFILGGVPERWNPINIYRTLVLVCIGYIEITISYAILGLVLNNDFCNLATWQQAIYSSVRNAVLIGSNFNPTSNWGLIIFVTQVLFATLFVTAVVNRTISHSSTSQ